MGKKCKICGQPFEPLQEHFELCPKCFRARGNKDSTFKNLLLKTYFDENGNILEEIYIDIPQNIANIFKKENLTIKQLRDFFQIVSRARIYGMIKIERAREILYQCRTKLEYQKSRGKITNSFYEFMKHHLEIACKDKEHLEAFYQHFDSIVCYFPRE